MFLYSSRIASTGFMARALAAGKIPATSPRTSNAKATQKAMENGIWKLANVCEPRRMSGSKTPRIATAAMSPDIPAMRVIISLSVRI